MLFGHSEYAPVKEEWFDPAYEVQSGYTHSRAQSNPMSYGAHYQSKQVICLLVHLATTHSIQLFNSFPVTMAKVESLELFGHET